MNPQLIKQNNPEVNQTETHPSLKPATPEQLKNIIEMLDSWCNVSEEEAQEQKETLQYLMKALEITE
ncbi:hypothetical protein IQ264_32445 [Phormidium sp. LEGE 05292]|uniref:hypothetical protein n=1 Tax=[Phormidium] sp. LEGE 05292 TaxID=767427 RepID=UPI0018829DAE|nr:hypothetical protein [Phormidium sp. LEGE 05292]MBE9230110.1 hypothetical protein [Phormidium sp. LEGE 05292]